MILKDYNKQSINKVSKRIINIMFQQLVRGHDDGWYDIDESKVKRDLLEFYSHTDPNIILDYLKTSPLTEVNTSRFSFRWNPVNPVKTEVNIYIEGFECAFALIARNIKRTGEASIVADGAMIRFPSKIERFEYVTKQNNIAVAVS